MMELPVPTHTEEARELLAAGEVAPGDPALDLPTDSMTDREMLVEILIHERQTRDAVVAFIESVKTSPLGSMMNGKGSPFGAMFGA